MADWTGRSTARGVLRPADMGRAPLTGQSDAAWDFTIDTNLWGTFRCLHAQLGAAADGGSIVNLTSTVGVQGLTLDARYCASKHGVSNLQCTAQHP